VGNLLARARTAGVTTWAEVEALDDAALEARLYVDVTAASGRVEPDCAWIHRERSRPGVTLDLLHEEYLQTHPGGYQYTAFCNRYRDWLRRRGLWMRQVHVAGDKMLVDYAGKKPTIVDSATGEVIEVELFVSVLGASNLTYAEVTYTQRGPDWIASHVRSFEYFGGVTRATVCDQLKSGVARACRYEPETQRTYEEMALHYGTTVLPARPRSPRDKAKVEVAVQIAERWILGRLRNEVFFSLGALNARIGVLLVELNARVMKRYGKSRRQLFAEIEKPALGPLPSARFEYCEWSRAKVNIDYHIVFDGHFYSVPHALVHEQVEVRATEAAVEVVLRSSRVASHVRSRVRGGFSTLPDHMPRAHRAHADWTPSRILSWAEKVGLGTRALCEAILIDRPHPEQGFRSCLGILRLGKRYGQDRLEAACARALRVRARSYRHVESILKHGLDRVPARDDEERTQQLTLTHENVRGRDYYH